MGSNTWLKDTLLIISLEAILSGQKGINQNTYQFVTGRGQHNICLVYFLLVSKFMHSIPVPKVVQAYNCSTNKFNLPFFKKKLILW